METLNTNASLAIDTPHLFLGFESENLGFAQEPRVVMPSQTILNDSVVVFVEDSTGAWFVTTRDGGDVDVRSITREYNPVFDDADELIEYLEAIDDLPAGARTDELRGLEQRANDK